MILRYYGHSLFVMTLENGTVLATDPYGDFYHYPKRRLKADVVTVSHQHHDHNAVGMIEGAPTIVQGEGERKPCQGLRITGVATKHDECGGTKRGDNTVMVIEAEGLKLVHLGDLGHVPTAAQCLSIGTPDILMIPVGGYYTIDARAAAEVVALLRPRVTIPMHYRTEYDAEMPIETQQPFLDAMGIQAEPMSVCRLTKDDLGERPAVLLMSVS